ncbi:acyltransferase [Marinoscillum sp.]|uniref:acyltransferase n=1 Tax=Marinoscillum sp. TaxID=2024838 RepID=UPI003BAD9CD0
MKKITKWNRLIMKWKSLTIPDGPYGDRARGKLYEPFLKSYGKNFKVGAQAFIFNPNGLSVGDDVYIGFNSYLGQGEIDLEDEVLIGNFVSLTASNHLMKGESFRFGGFHAEKIAVKKGTWIGSQSSITAGVTIGRSCLIASGAVVTKSFSDGWIIGGVPAKNIGLTKDFKEKYEF